MVLSRIHVSRSLKRQKGSINYPKAYGKGKSKAAPNLDGFQQTGGGEELQYFFAQFPGLKYPKAIESMAKTMRCC